MALKTLVLALKGRCPRIQARRQGLRQVPGDGLTRREKHSTSREPTARSKSERGTGTTSHSGLWGATGGYVVPAPTVLESGIGRGVDLNSQAEGPIRQEASSMILQPQPERRLSRRTVALKWGNLGLSDGEFSGRTAHDLAPKGESEYRGEPVQASLSLERGVGMYSSARSSGIPRWRGRPR
jgi:hypothetical protein